MKRYIGHGLGLGDHIILNGLIRELYAKYVNDDLFLVVKKRNAKNVKRMFEDLDRLNYFEIETNNLGEGYTQEISDAPMICIDHKINDIVTSDESCYLSMNIDFKKRWESFYVKRHLDKENSLEKYLNLPKDFILIHNEGSGASFPNLPIASNLPRVYVQKVPAEDSIFDWMGVIEKAKEIHGINSSFTHLVESMTTVSADLYFHNVYQPDYPFYRKLNWRVV
jgi:hypothetical protein